MKAVNLLPASERPREVRQAPANASVAVMAVLGVLVLAVAGWVFTKNGVNDRRSDIATANQEKAEADQRSQGLKAFGDFSEIKQTRVQSVTELAGKRFDWERLMRELALVLPQKVWVSNVTAGGNADVSAAAAPPAAGSGTAAAASDARTIGLTGCAPSQKSVAETIVRLRSLYGAEEVDLKDSAKAGEEGAAPPGASSDGASEGSTGCGRYYQFNASISFKAPEASDSDKPVRAPSRLGGGA